MTKSSARHLTLQQCLDSHLYYEVKRRWSAASCSGELTLIRCYQSDWLSVNLTTLPGTDKIGATTLTAVVIEDEPWVMTELGAMSISEAFGEEWIPSPAEIEQKLIQIRVTWSEDDLQQRKLKLWEASNGQEAVGEDW